MQRQTDSELLTAARRRPAALGEFYDRYERPVLTFFMRRCGDAHLAVELTAETFAEVVLQCHREVEVQEPTSWLFAIARSKLADYGRRGAVDRRAMRKLGVEPIAAEDDQLERIEQLLSDSRATIVDEALADLPEAERNAVVAHVVDERPYAEIAARSAVSEQVIRKRVSRGLGRLRERLKEVR